jgi:hypothetical protein
MIEGLGRPPSFASTVAGANGDAVRRSNLAAAAANGDRSTVRCGLRIAEAFTVASGDEDVSSAQRALRVRPFQNHQSSFRTQTIILHLYGPIGNDHDHVRSFDRTRPMTRNGPTNEHCGNHNGDYDDATTTINAILGPME